MADRRGEARADAEFAALNAANHHASDRRDLAAKTQVIQQQKVRDQKRSERLLFRSLRSAGGGFFASNPQRSTLGGTEVLG